MMNVTMLLGAGTQFLDDGDLGGTEEVEVTLGSSLDSIMAKLTELMSEIWPWIIGIMVAAVVIWGAYIGIRIAIAHRNEDQVNARAMVKNLVIGVLVMFVIAVGAPLLIQGLNAWVG